MSGIVYGLFEQIINGIIHENLTKIDQELLIKETQPIDSAESCKILAEYLTRILREIFEYIDDKTNREMYDPEQTMQLKTYAYGVFKQFPEAETVTAGLFFLRYNQFRHTVYHRKDVMRSIPKFYKAVGKEILAKIP